MSRSFTLGIVIVVIAVAGMGAIFAAGNSVISQVGSITTSITGGSSSQSSGSAGGACSDCTAAPPAGFGQSVVQAHIDNINARDPTKSAADFTSNGVMIWSGNTQGLGGTYSGQSNIRFTLSTAIGGATTLSYKITSFTAYGSASNPNMAEAKVVQNFTGNSHILGDFNGVINSTFTYVKQGGTWMISQENSYYESFNTQFSLGATTFPQWQLTGAPLPHRYSESPFKNWVYYYGGAAAAIGVACYLAALPLVVHVRKKRASNRSSERRV